MQSTKEPVQPAVLTVGFSPAAAVTTWRLAKSRAFQCYTYWPTAAVTFQSEVFGSEQVYESLPFDLNDTSRLAALPNRSFAVVILVIPTIKDVARMCRKVQPVLSKQTLVLVDVSGGIAPLQRLVKTNLGSAYQVSGMICDIDAEFSVVNDKWTVEQRRLSTKAGTNSNVITLEPSASQIKTLASLEAAWTAGGLTAVKSKTSSAFGELQWQRTIGVVVFELLTVALDTPEPETLVNSLIAKPIIEGLVGELTMVAAASGIKGLPSKSQLVSRGPGLARRAPASFKTPHASRTYYDVYRKSPIALDFLLLLPILLSDELPKGGATPYLESLYAYMSHLMDINMGVYASELFQRVDPNAPPANKKGGAAAATQSVDPAVVVQLESRAKALDTRENDIQAREARYQQVLEELRAEQQQHAERVSQFDNQWAQNERRLQSFEELNARSEQLRLREEQMNDSERKFSLRDRSFKQRELELINREQALIARETEILSRRYNGMANGSAHPGPNPALPQNQNAQNVHGGTPPQMSPQIPMTPGGTVYSRFDPRAPQVANSAPNNPSAHQNGSATPHIQQSGQQGQQFYGMPASSSASIASNMRARQSIGGGPQPMMSRPGSRTQIAAQQSMPAQFYGGPNGPQGPGGPGNGLMNGRTRRPPRRMSMNDEPDMMQGGPAARRRQQSMPSNLYGGHPQQHPQQQQQPPQQSNLFSQNFQLDGVMGVATDRYHFVSRARNSKKDVKLSSDEEAYHASRKFLHGAGGGSGGGGTGNPHANGYAGSVNNMPLDGPGAYPGSATPRSIHPGDVSSSSNGLPMSSSRRSMSNVPSGLHHSHSAVGMSSPNDQPRSLLPTNIVPSGGPDFSGFNFGEGLENNRGGGVTSTGSTGSQNLSSTGSNGTPTRSRSGTPPTPQGTINPIVLNSNQKWNENNAEAATFSLS